MERRAFVVGFGLLALAGGAAFAQPAGGPKRVGWLEWTDQGHFSEITARAFVAGLREGGFEEGRNLAIEKRVAFGNRRKLAEQARELAALKVDVLFTPAKAATDAAWYASRAIPTVIATVTDPVAVQYAHSLARPGKHITGVTTASAELTGKRLELLHTATGGAKRVAVLFDKALYDTCQEELKQLRGAAKKLDVTLVEVPVESIAVSIAELEPAFRRMTEAKAQALIMPLFTSVSDFAPEIARLAVKYRMPTMHEVEDASAGYLISYGPNFADVYRRAGLYVARILKGGKPAEMPIEEPRRFVMTANLKVARALGLTLPPALLVQADRVIE